MLEKKNIYLPPNEGIGFSVFASPKSEGFAVRGGFFSFDEGVVGITGVTVGVTIVFVLSTGFEIEFGRTVGTVAGVAGFTGTKMLNNSE